MVKASGSLRTSSASANATWCLDRFRLAFTLSHVMSTCAQYAYQYAYCNATGSSPAHPQRSGGRVPPQARRSRIAHPVMAARTSTPPTSVASEGASPIAIHTHSGPSIDGIIIIRSIDSAPVT